VFGFAALKPILLQEGVYDWLCNKDELDEDVRVCYRQEIQYDTHWIERFGSPFLTETDIG